MYLIVPNKYVLTKFLLGWLCTPMTIGMLDPLEVLVPSPTANIQKV